MRNQYTALGVLHHTESDRESADFLDGLYEYRVDSATGRQTGVYKVYAEGSLVAQVAKERRPDVGVTTTNTKFVVSDHQGSPIAVHSSVGEALQRFSYEPYGKRTTFKGVPVSSADDEGVRAGFTGHRVAHGVGLIDMGGRWFDPSLRRFLSPDPHPGRIDLGRVVDRFRYSSHDPVNRWDPTGFEDGEVDAVPEVNADGSIDVWVHGEPREEADARAAEEAAREAAEAALAELVDDLQGLRGPDDLDVDDDDGGYQGDPSTGSAGSGSRQGSSGVMGGFRDAVTSQIRAIPNMVVSAVGGPVVEGVKSVYDIASTFGDEVPEDVELPFLGSAAAISRGDIGYTAAFFATTVGVMAISRAKGRFGAFRKVNGRYPINAKKWAGKVHPSGVRFNDAGFPDFGPYAKAEVQIHGLVGNYAKDSAMANAAVGLKGTPKGMVWHHVEDGVTMQLIPRSIHQAARHTGGSAVLRGKR